MHKFLPSFLCTRSTITSPSPTHIHRIPGLLAVVLSDRDGVVVEQARRDGLPEGLPSPGLLATLAVTSEQGSKLGFNACKGVVSMFNEYQVVHFLVSPFVVSLYATADANT
eukprot:Ihof_evm3s516 gene=Ihof_evmTU3s516